MMLAAPKFWYDTRETPNRLLAQALSPLGKAYGWMVQKRFEFYYPVPLAKPVLCVGNLVAGGAGKTPVVQSLVPLMQQAGFNPHILTRGYGGEEEGPLQVSPDRDTHVDVGDEALVLVEKAPTWVSKNRALGAQAAIDTGADLIIMDDGFQNPSIHKDFALLVVDGQSGFGNGNIFPAGPLRESVADGLSRAHAVAVVGEDKAGVELAVKRHSSAMPVFHAVIKPDTAGNPELFGKPVFAFAGIGRPEKFRDTLIAAGAMLEGWGSFADHFRYMEEDLRELVAAADKQNALILTTVKDHVRLPNSLKERIKKFRVHLEWKDPQGLSSLLGGILGTAE